MTESLFRRIAIRLDPQYDRGRIEPPYRPGKGYPELPPVTSNDIPNSTYDAVRALLRLWSPDDPTDEACWSPFSSFVKPGMRVAVKPNLVLHRHPDGEAAMRGTVTDAAVLRPILDYVAQALRGNGTITVADSPIRMTDFNAVVKWSGLDAVLDDVSSAWGVNVELIDIRDQTVADIRSFSTNLRVREQAGDPRGVARIDLGADSALEPLGDTMPRLRSTAAVGRNETRDQHRAGHHVYAFSRSVLDADVIINVPKLKTHKKTGITCAMKNFVGSVVRKEWLPHHRKGSPAVGGDEYADGIEARLKFRERAKDLHLQSRLGRGLVTPALWLYQRAIRGTVLDVFRARPHSRMVNGGWSGNDTCWRMVHDLFRAVRYGQGHGTLASEPVRSPLTLVDGLIAGEGDGPLCPSPRRAGILMLGFDGPWIDHYAALLMGYDPARIPQLARAVDSEVPRPLTRLRCEDLDLQCDPTELAKQLRSDSPLGNPFVPPAGWARELVGEEMYQRALHEQSRIAVDY